MVTLGGGTMSNVVCRDCGKPGSEDPDDPAPALCPACYEQRLQRITDLFMPIIASLKSSDITPAIVWLAKALEDIGGEKPEYARQHADTLAWAVVLQTRQN